MVEKYHLNKTYELVLTGLLFAVALVLAMVENTLPPLIITVPGIKFGLSNIAVMYALFFLKKRQAFMIAVLKAFFVLFTRGAVAGLLSLCGGLLSLCIMILLLAIFKEHISYLMISIFGAVFHNIGQLATISLLFTNLYLWAYFPVLLISGVAAGVITSTLLKFILPAFQKLVLNKK